MFAGMLDDAVGHIVTVVEVLATPVVAFIQPLIAFRLNRIGAIGNALLHESHNIRLCSQVVASVFSGIARLLAIHHVSDVVHRAGGVNDIGLEAAGLGGGLEARVLVVGKILGHGDKFSADIVPLFEDRIGHIGGGAGGGLLRFLCAGWCTGTTSKENSQEKRELLHAVSPLDEPPREGG